MNSQALFDKLVGYEQRYKELELKLGEAATVADQSGYQKLAKEFSSLTPAVEAYRGYLDLQHQLKELEQLLQEKHEPDFEELAKAESEALQAQMQEMLQTLNGLAFPKKEEKDRDLIIEIRAGTGGQEAAIFAGDLYRMYSKYAERRSWKFDPISSHVSESGGFKEVVFGISGPRASKLLKWESGVHRVQRVPATEASGRIHTSAATVAVLFEPEEVDITVDPKDLKVDVFRSSGPGGQSVNTTDSAIRITHLPTNLVVICQDERSQLKNKHKAMRVLRARLLDRREQENLAKATQDRKAKVGSGDRSEKIHTYNYPDRRVTDHRIGLTLHKLPHIMDGDLDDVTAALVKAEREAEDTIS